MFLLIGYLSGFLGLFANVPYIIDTLRGKTQPHRISWLVFLLINLINVANQLAVGASHSLWLTVGFCVSQAIIVFLAFRNGIGGFKKLDIICLIGAVIGMGLWMYFQTPIVSIIANIVAATIALVPTLVKAYKQPQTETKVSWGLGAVAALMGAVAVGSFTIELLLFPVYSCAAQLLVYMVLVAREKPIIWRWKAIAFAAPQKQA